MNLEEFLDRELSDERRELIERRRQASAHLSKLERSLQEGDLEQAGRVLGWLEVTLGKQQEALERLKGKLPAYDLEAYLREDFDAEFRAACCNQDLTVTGNFPTYEVFPFRVHVNSEKHVIELNDRIVHFLRPAVLASYLKAQKNRLYKEKFNPTKFLDALASTYDTFQALRQARHKMDIQKNLDVSLIEIYERLTPLPVQRRQYPRNMFAFDLHRLYVADVFTTSNGRRLVFGDTRQRGKAIVVYDAQSREHRFGSLRFTEGGESL